MRQTVWLARILGIGALLETGAGLGLLVVPSALASLLFGSPLQGSGLIVARLAGGGLLSLGIACWFARGTPGTPAGLGVSRAFLVYNLVASATLVWARLALGSGGFLVLFAAALHGALGAALLAALSGRSQSSTR